MTRADVVVHQIIAASPDALYDLVSDVTRMNEWSPETTSCRWLPPATGPAVSAQFRGTNRHGWRRWSTTCTVITAEPGRRFAFDVLSGRRSVSQWSYDFAAHGTRCRVVESWTDRRPWWLILVSAPATGVADRESHNRAGMAATLAALARAAEPQSPRRP